MLNSTNTSKSTWSRARIEELLAVESFRYQSIPLPHGLRTEGHDRSTTAELIFPPDFEGRSFMDIGCSLGFFCFEAKRRGAGRVLGIDVAPENVRKGRILADVIGEDVEFTTKDIEREAIGETFDMVICLNVMHHLLHPMRSLDILTAAANRRLVLEMATFGAHDRRKLGMNFVEQLLINRLPTVLVGKGGSAVGIKQFYFTERSIENLLRYRRGCFASVKIIPSDFKGRFIVIAEKRRIGSLIVSAGPTCAGMDETTGRLAGGELAEVASAFSMAGADPGPTLLAADYHQPQEVEQDKMVLEYDILRPSALGAYTVERDPAGGDVIDCADDVSFLTTWAPPEVLAPRIEARMVGAKKRERKQLSRALEDCGDARRLVTRYREWFAYCAGKAGEHRVAWIKDGKPVVMTPEEWETQVAEPLLAANRTDKPVS